MNLQQDTADRTGQVVVQAHYLDGEVARIDVYWPSEGDCTTIRKDALRLLLEQVPTANWHEGDT